jgi:hypothetical protein
MARVESGTIKFSSFQEALEANDKCSGCDFRLLCTGPNFGDPDFKAEIDPGMTPIPPDSEIAAYASCFEKS